MKKLSTRTKAGAAGAAAALVLGGAALTALLLTGGTASGETSPGAGSSAAGDHRGGNGEKPLTGTTAAKVKAAALAKYPGATVEELETDADGVYEAHLTTKDGQHVTVEVGKTFAVTGIETGRGGPGGRHGADEKPLTGTTAAKVKAAALAKYPGATVEELETDADGVYEAHLTTKDGQHVTVEVGKDFAVTGTETGRGGRGGRHGDRDGDGRGPGDDADAG